MSAQEQVTGWSCVVGISGHPAGATGAAAVVVELGEVQLIVIAPGVAQAEEAAIAHVKEHTHVQDTHVVTEARISMLKRIDSCCVVWRAVMH